MMKSKGFDSGFSAVELMVALFVGTLLMLGGYQLSGMALNRAKDSREMAEASTIGRYIMNSQPKLNSGAAVSCSNPNTTSVDPPENKLTGNASVTVEKCHPTSFLSISKIKVTVKYGPPESEEEVVHAIYK